MSMWTRVLFVALAAAITGLVLLVTSYVSALALPWFASLTAAESSALPIVYSIVTVVGVVVVVIARARQAENRAPP